MACILMESKSLNKHRAEENIRMAYSETRQFKTVGLINEDNIWKVW